MTARIEDYGLIGDLQTAALVGRDGSIDWACFPRFDSGACFAAILGDSDHGRWIVAPRGDAWEGGRRYRPRTLVLETDWETDTGVVRVLDFMPPRGKAPDIVRIVEGVRGHVDMFSELVIRFDYGGTIPWVRRIGDGRIAVAGPDGLCLRTPVEHRGENMRTIGEFTVRKGDRIPFTLTWYPSNERPPRAIDAEHALNETLTLWEDWSNRCDYTGKWKDDVQGSLTVLKALTYAPTGGIVAAPTTSLPERIGGERNWDYRYCWLRDASFTVAALGLASTVKPIGYHMQAMPMPRADECGFVGADQQLLLAVAGEPAVVVDRGPRSRNHRLRRRRGQGRAVDLHARTGIAHLDNFAVNEFDRADVHAARRLGREQHLRPAPHLARDDDLLLVAA